MRTLALSLRAGAWMAAIAGLVLTALYPLMPSSGGAFGIFDVSIDGANLNGLPTWLRVLAMFAAPLAFAVSMYHLAGWLQFAARNEVFSAPAAAFLRRCGVWLLITTLVGIFVPFAAKGLYLLLTHAEHGSLSLGMSSHEVWNIFLSALFMLVARVLSDAYRIAEENRQII